MEFSISEWMEAYQKKASEVFGSRICFLGVQGSRARGEGRNDSDIDMVLILDKVEIGDLKAYRRFIGEMERADLACGFISGRQELANWPGHELFQFYHDTKPILGSLDFLLHLITREKIAQAVKLGAANLYHGACHSMVFENPEQNLPMLQKQAFFILQAKAYLETGVYWGSKAALLAHLEEEERALLENREMETVYAELIIWSGNLLKGHEEYISI